MKHILKVVRQVGIIWLVTVNESCRYQMESLLKQLEDTTWSTFEVGAVPLSELPDNIQAKVKETLKAFDKTTVVYEAGDFEVETGCCIRKSYFYDHFVCGIYNAKEVYTLEERKQNFLEEFGYPLPKQLW